MVERLYPGVYVTELAFHAKPIDGVSTSVPANDVAHAAAHGAELPAEPSPDWTQHNPSDPGITLVQVFAWLGESLLFRAPAHATPRMTHVQSGWGVAQGLAVEPRAADGTDSIAVSRGLALAANGQPVTTDSDPSPRHVRKP